MLTGARLMELVRAERRDEAITLLLPAFRDAKCSVWRTASCATVRKGRRDAGGLLSKFGELCPDMTGAPPHRRGSTRLPRNASVSALRARHPQSSLSDPEVMEAAEANFTPDLQQMY